MYVTGAFWSFTLRYRLRDHAGPGAHEDDAGYSCRHIDKFESALDEAPREQEVEIRKNRGRGPDEKLKPRKAVRVCFGVEEKRAQDRILCAGDLVAKASE